MLDRLLFRLELRFDNFKSKRKLKRFYKDKADLEWIIGVELKKAPQSEVQPAIDRYNKLLKAIELEKLFMLDLK